LTLFRGGVAIFPWNGWLKMEGAAVGGNRLKTLPDGERNQVGFYGDEALLVRGCVRVSINTSCRGKGFRRGPP